MLHTICFTQLAEVYVSGATTCITNQQQRYGREIAQTQPKINWLHNRTTLRPHSSEATLELYRLVPRYIIIIIPNHNKAGALLYIGVV